MLAELSAGATWLNTPLEGDIMTISRTKKALPNRLDKALQNMYHNATPDHPHNVPQELWGDYEDRFNLAAEFEIEYIRDGLGCSASEYEKARKRGWPHKGERDAWLVSRITEHGNLYQWGRGGRTLAPDNLIRQRGGSSFAIVKADAYDSMDNEALTEFVQVVEAFNSYVERWNSRENLTALWVDTCVSEIDELQRCAANTRHEAKRLARDALAIAKQFTTENHACKVLRREIAGLRAGHKKLVQRIALYMQAKGCCHV